MSRAPCTRSSTAGFWRSGATIISTNLAPEEIGSRYGRSVLSRLEGDYEILPFFGEDIRRLKRERQ